MRINSPKQSKASRKNGSKSKGPKSPTGKKKASQNAIQDGVFSRQVIIEKLGEEKAEFEALKKRLQAFFQPSNVVEEMLVADFIENWWRRERIRRAEAVELRNRLACLSMRNNLRRIDGPPQVTFLACLPQLSPGFKSSGTGKDSPYHGRVRRHPGATRLD